MPQDLEKLTKKELKQFLNSFDHVFCDCDGVIFATFKPIEGSAEALEKLKACGKQVAYITNNTSVSPEDLAKFLTGIGVNAQTKDIIQPLVAIITYLKSINFDKKIYFIGFKAARKVFLDAGFDLANYEPTADAVEKAEVLVSYLVDDVDIGAVIVEYDCNINFIRLQKALVYLKRPEVLFIRGSTDLKIPFGKDQFIIGPGYFQKIVEELSGRTPLTFGKPGKDLSDYASKHFNVNPQRTLFIGDTFSDMIFASEGGYQKLMVFSGIVTQNEMEKCKDEKMLPDYYLNSLNNLNQLLDGIDAKL